MTAAPQTRHRTVVDFRLTPRELSMTRQMLLAGCGRDELAATLNVCSNRLGGLMKFNGLDDLYSEAMLARRTQQTGSPDCERVDLSEAATRRSSDELARRLMAAGPPPAPAARRERTFEEKLQLLKEGKARLVPNVKIGRPDPAMTSTHGEAMS